MSIIRDQSKGVKRLLMDPRLIPNTALLDPEMTVSLPPTVTASSGVDAFSHAIEAMLSLGANPVSDLFAKESIKLLYENVPAAVADGSRLPARSGNLLAATLAGIAFQNALVGVVHALAHGLGGKFGIGHGLAIAICLPVGLEYNLDLSRGKIMEIGGLIIPGAGCAEKVIEGIRGWLDKIGLSRKLSELGAGREDLAQAAELAMKDPAILTNPRKPESSVELLELLKKVY
jgi:alcohol dehydrogenase